VVRQAPDFRVPITAAKGESPMQGKLSRRQILAGAGAVVALAGLGMEAPGAAGASPLPEIYPTQNPDEVRELVTVAHFDLARVKELVARRPSLARATWDWGFGDWESALGAASHMGNRNIAEFLLDQGARPDLFSAAMLGHLDVIRAHVAAWPGAERIKGPHGITLLAHAHAGGDRALPVVRFLAALGDADPTLTVVPLAPQEVAALLGRYRCGPDAADVFVVEPYQGGISLRRTDAMARPLAHLGSRVFSPAGADAVRIRFSAESSAATLTIYDPGLVLTARRQPDGA
jgi:hypothetical protein